MFAQMVSEGISDEKARSQVYMVDRWGLLQERHAKPADFQQRLFKPMRTQRLESDGTGFSLLGVVRHAKPTVLVGVSGAPGLFSKRSHQRDEPSL